MQATTPHIEAGRRAEARRTGHSRRWLERLLVYGLLLGGVVLTGAPFAYMVTGSFKLDSEIYSLPIRWIPEAPTTLNYKRLLGGEEIPYVRQFLNSVLIGVSQTLLTLFICAMGGWGFAKYEFRGKRPLFLFLLGTLSLPGQITLIPLFLLMLKIGWLDSYLAVIVPGAISAFGIFFLRQTMLAIPLELMDAARIDGASERGIFWRIGLPLSRGPLSVLALLVFLGSWNDYLWPLIVLRSQEKFTYPVGLATLVGLYKVEYGMILAGAFLATLPVLIIFLIGRNHVLDNITIGSVKG